MHGVSIYQDETEAANYRGRRSNCIALFVSKTGSVCERAAVAVGRLLGIFLSAEFQLLWPFLALPVFN